MIRDALNEIRSYVIDSGMISHLKMYVKRLLIFFSNAIDIVFI